MLVAGARNTTANSKDLSNYDANMPHIDKLFSPKHFSKYILSDFSQIENYIMEARLDELQIRFNVWRILLGVFKPDSTTQQKIEALQSSRKLYDDLYKKYLKTDATPSAQNIKRDPLSRDTGNGMWNNYFENSELKNEVKKDVDRTYSDKEFFQNLKIKHLLTNVLFIWSKENSAISYRQGMNEVAASIIHVYFQECQNQKSISEYNLEKELEEIILTFNDVKYAEADVYTLFVRIMNEGQHMEMFRPNYTGQQQIEITTKLKEAKCYIIESDQDLGFRTKIGRFRVIQTSQIALCRVSNVPLKVVEMYVYQRISPPRFTSFMGCDILRVQLESRKQQFVSY